MDISIIVPLYNEAESLPKLYEWIARVMKENKFSYEVIFVNDGSTDESWKVIHELSATTSLNDAAKLPNDASPNGVRKVLIDQKMYIIKGDKMFDATGRRVE